jgi:diguanylate cyclase
MALDDFGSHNFSLSYLQNLNVDEVKLDQVFIAEINESKASHALVDAVIRLAHALDLNVVAEGVETEAQRAALAEMGCDHMQGYLFSKAVSEEKITGLFKQLSLNFEHTGEFLLTDYQSHSA